MVDLPKQTATPFPPPLLLLPIFSHLSSTAHHPPLYSFCHSVARHSHYLQSPTSFSLLHKSSLGLCPHNSSLTVHYLSSCNHWPPQSPFLATHSVPFLTTSRPPISLTFLLYTFPPAAAPTTMKPKKDFGCWLAFLTAIPRPSNSRCRSRAPSGTPPQVHQAIQTALQMVMDDLPYSR